MSPKKKKRTKSENSVSTSNDTAMKSPENVTITVSEEFIEIFKSSHNAFVTFEYVLTSKEKDVLNVIESKMDMLFCNLTCMKNLSFDNNIILAMSYLYISGMYSKMIESYLCIRDNYLMRALSLLEGREMDSKVIIPIMSILLDLSTIWVQLVDLTKAKSFLQKSITLYLQYTEEKDDYTVPNNFAVSFGLIPYVDPKYVLDTLYVLSLFNIIKICEEESPGFREGFLSLYTMYTHMILAKELKLANNNKMIWAIRAATLSQHFSFFGSFIEARNYLTAADKMLQKYNVENQITTHVSETPMTNNKLYKDYVQTYATIAIYWAKYWTLLLRLSRERLLQHMKCNPFKICMPCLMSISKEQCDMQFIFNDIEIDQHPLITDIIFNYNDAKTVFKKILLSYKNADLKDKLEQNDVRCFILSNDTISLGISKAYKYLTYYEENKANQMELHKQRIKVLEKFLTASPDINTDIDKYKEIIIEVAIAYSSLFDMKTEHLHAGDKLTIEVLSQVNELAATILEILRLYFYFVNSDQ